MKSTSELTVKQLFGSNPINEAICDRVYYIGHRYKHHALHSGYEGFGRYIGTFLKPPVSFRWTLGVWGWKLNQLITFVTRHPSYSLGSFLTEAAVLLHMMGRKEYLYHLLYGDSDLWLLGFLTPFRWLTRNKIVASFHQPSEHLRELRIVEKIAKNIDAVILVSDVQRAYFEEFLPPERVFVIPHGVDSDFFYPLEDVKQEPICITVGSHLRDFKTLKQAMQLVWKVNPEVRFVAVGTRHEKKNYFEGVADDRIQYLEGISDEDLRSAYQSAQVAVFPFRDATANNAILEAMACGLPIVATDVGGTCEYIDDTTGVLCSPNDPQAFANSILGVINDSSTRIQKAKKSRERALKYHYRLIADQMCAVYSKLLDLS